MAMKARKRGAVFSGVMFGADPEVFLKDGLGVYRSAIGLIGGSKYAPRRIDDDGSAVQEDNVAVEFNTAPAKDKINFIKSVLKPLNYIKNFVNERAGLTVAIEPSAFFQLSELEHPLAKEFGCDIDFNAWNGGKPNPKPRAAGKIQALRTCGGHLHISWREPSDEDKPKVIQALDLFLGVPSTLMDEDSLRRKLYGKAGAYRPKDYGIEYRVLSNFWIKSPKYIGWVVDGANRAIDMLSEGFDPGMEKKRIMKAINNGDKLAAHSLIKQYELKIL